MLKAIIIDDEQPCITALSSDLAMFCPQVNLLDRCASAKEGLMSIKKHLPDLVFLDIEMPVINGFELLEMIGSEINFQLIFTTAYENFATRAFKVSALDYLLKPVDGNDLIQAVSRAEKAIAQQRNSGQQVVNLILNNALPPGQQKLALPNRDGYEFVSAAEVIYCKADGSYTQVSLTDGRMVLLSRSLGEIEGLLPGALFERIHHSCVINLSYVRQFRKTEGSSIVMENGDQLTVARSKKEQLLQRLGIKQGP